MIAVRFWLVSFVAGFVLLRITWSIVAVFWIVVLSVTDAVAISPVAFRKLMFAVLLMTTPVVKLIMKTEMFTSTASGPVRLPMMKVLFVPVRGVGEALWKMT